MAESNNTTKYIPSAERQCLSCGETFFTRPSYVAKGSGKYCSVACYRAYKYGSLEDRFFSRIEKTDNCWLWIGQRDKDGYGHITHNGTNRTAYRVSYEIHIGAIPEGLCVLHRCDNPPCVRPDHLFLGTHADNVADRNTKGRQAKGENGRHALAKLNTEQVREIRGRFSNGETNKSALARAYHVNYSTVNAIIRGHTWKGV